MKGVQRIAIGLVAAGLLGLLLAGCGDEPQPVSTPSGQPPVVAIVVPQAGTTVQKGQTVDVQSQAVDEKGVTRVELWADGTLVRSDASAQAAGQTVFSVSQPWLPAVPGSHAIMVKAYDADNLVTESSVLIVNVQASPVALATATGEAAPLSTVPLPQPTAQPPTSEPTTRPTDIPPTVPPTVAPTAVPAAPTPVDKPPSLELLSPASPYTTQPGSDLTLKLRATDDKGVTRIELWADGKLYRKDEVGGGKTVNWVMDWTPPALGTYVLEVKALDTKFKPSPVRRLEVRVEPAVTLPPPYDDIWAQMGGAAGALGMPLGDVVLRPAAGQEFEHGYMIWRDNATGQDRIYVIVWGPGGSQQAGDLWGQFSDTWVEGVDPELSCAQAVLPNGPKRGFGKVWCTVAGMRSDLRAAIEIEAGYDGGWLDFEHGTAIWDRRHNRAFVLLHSGEWQAVAVPAVP